MRLRAPKLVSPSLALAGALLFAALTGQARAEETNPCFTGNGTVKEVLDACAAFIASGSTDKERLNTAHRVRAMALSAIGDLDTAIAELDAATKVNSSEPNSYFMRAAAYDAKKDFDKAIADLDEAIRLDGKRGDFYMLRGIVYNHRGDLDRALVEFNEKVKLDPEATNGYSKRADLYRQRKEYDPPSPTTARSSSATRSPPRPISIAAGSTCSRAISTRPAPTSTRRSSCIRTTHRRWSAAAW